MNRVRAALFSLLLVAVLKTVSFAQNTGGLFIKVHSETGQAVAGVEVRVESSRGSSVQGVTDLEGQARITGLAPGSYRFVAGMQGFEESSQSFNVEDDRQTIEIDVTLHVKLQRNDQIDVFASPDQLNAQQASPPSTVLQAEEIASLPIRAVTAPIPFP